MNTYIFDPIEWQTRDWLQDHSDDGWLRTAGLFAARRVHAVPVEACLLYTAVDSIARAALELIAGSALILSSPLLFTANQLGITKSDASTLHYGLDLLASAVFEACAAILCVLTVVPTLVVPYSAIALFNLLGKNGCRTQQQFQGFEELKEIPNAKNFRMLTKDNVETFKKMCSDFRSRFNPTEDFEELVENKIVTAEELDSVKESFYRFEELLATWEFMKNTRAEIEAIPIVNSFEIGRIRQWQTEWIAKTQILEDLKAAGMIDKQTIQTFTDELALIIRTYDEKKAAEEAEEAEKAKSKAKPKPESKPESKPKPESKTSSYNFEKERADDEAFIKKHGFKAFLEKIAKQSEEYKLF